MTRIRTTLAACGIIVPLLAGCSGASGKKASAPATTGQAGGPTTTLRPADTTFSGQGSAEFCALARTYNDRFSKVDPTASGTQLRAVAREGQAAITQAANAAPAEIKADVVVISSAFGSLVADLEKVNYDFSKVTVDTFAKLQAPDFAASTQRFQSYMTNVCKIPS